TNDSPEIPLPVLPSDFSSDAPSRTLSPVSDTAMNTLKIDTKIENEPAETEGAQDCIHPSGENDVVTLPNSTRINGSSLPSHANADRSPISRPNQVSISPTVRNISAEFGPLRS